MNSEQPYGHLVRISVRYIRKTAGRTSPLIESEADKTKIGEILDDLHSLGFRNSTGKMISSTLSGLLSEELVHPTVHRNPSPHNIYYKSENITLINLNVADGPALMDIVLAEIGLELMTSRLPYDRQSQRRYLIKEFWAGYRHCSD